MKTHALPYRIYIPTRGRIDHQITLRKLPTYIHKKVTLVCPKSEARALREAYPDVDVVGQPNEIKTIAAKRAWIACELSRSKEEPFWFQADDDLSFYVFDHAIDKHRVCSEENERLQRKFWLATLPDLVYRYDSVGIGTKAFALPGGVKENYHLGFFFGMSQHATKSLKWNRISLYEDIDYTLQLLKLGFQIGITYDVSLSQRAAESAGGLTETGERDAKKIEKALELLIQFHPTCISRKEASGQHSMSNTRVSWKTAAVIGTQARSKQRKLF